MDDDGRIWTNRILLRICEGWGSSPSERATEIAVRASSLAQASGLGGGAVTVEPEL
jgi:hypothetical protein